MTSINLGCGRLERPGFLGVDRVRGGAARLFADGTRLPFRSSSLDQIAAHHFVEHIPDLEALFAEFYRVLKSGGILWVRVPYKTAGLYDPFHCHVFDEKSFFAFTTVDPNSLQMKPHFKIVRQTVHRRLLPNRRYDLRYHLMKRFPEWTRKFLHPFASIEDLDGRERLKIGFRDEIECILRKR